MIEVEFKYRIADSGQFEQQLAARADTVFIDERIEVDTYFEHPCRDFAKTDEALRVREVNGITSLTWKGERLDLVSQTRRELEVGISSGSAKTVNELLCVLAFQPVLVVKKLRRTYSVSGQNFDVRLCIYTVEGLPPHVELEILRPDETTRLAATEALKNLAILLNLVEPESRTYLELLVSA